MGMILSRFRKKKSIIETLEKLQNDIREIEENQSHVLRKHERITKKLFLYSVVLYILCGIIFYFQFTSTLKWKLLYLVALALSPLLLYIIRKIISWYYIRLNKKNQLRLEQMKKMKKKLLEEVMDKETYKVAKKILDKYSTENVPKSPMQLTVAQPDPGLRRRLVGTTKNMPPNAQQMRSMGRGQSPPQQVKPVNTSVVPSRGLSGGPLMRLPAPIFPLDRSYIDRVVEYLIGDGPNNRYALICSRCHSHNGMALKEEFEYIGFKCCYCFFFNPARKIRPQAPKLDVTPRLHNDNESDSDSDSETSVGSEVLEGQETTASGNSLDIKKEVVAESEISKSPIQDYKPESNNSEIPADEDSDVVSPASEDSAKKEETNKSSEDDEEKSEDGLEKHMELDKTTDEEILSKS